jgi:lysyl-tRNA synthetase class 2
MSDYDLNKLEQTRFDKMQRLRENGQEPFPTKVERSHTNAEAISTFEADETEDIQATLVGRIRSLRPMGKVLFMHVEDGSGQIQFFFRQNEVGDEALDLLKREYDLGDFIQASGKMFRTKAGEVSLWVRTSCHLPE